MPSSTFNAQLRNKKNTFCFLAKVLSISTFVTLLVFFTIRYYHIDYHIYCQVKGLTPKQEQWNQPQWQGKSLWLPDFKFDIHAKVVAGVKDNLSGLSYDYDQNLIIAVTNSPTEIFILDLDGTLLRRHPIQGANDTEGITYLGNRMVAILQEKRRSILIAEIPLENGESIIVTENNAYKLDIPKDRNNGPEGITYDHRTDTFYVVKERKPAGLYAIQGLITTPDQTTQTNLSAYLEALPFATDLSGIALDPTHKNLVLLSDEAQMLITITLDGQPVNYLSLAPWGFQLPPPQPEGITIDSQGTIYIVSEPNLFYRLNAASQQPEVPTP